MKSKRSFEQYRHRGIEQCILQGRYILRAKLHVATYKTIFLSIHATRAQFYLPTAIDRRKREKKYLSIVRSSLGVFSTTFVSFPPDMFYTWQRYVTDLPIISPDFLITINCYLSAVRITIDYK